MAHRYLSDNCCHPAVRHGDVELVFARYSNAINDRNVCSLYLCSGNKIVN